MFLWVIDTYRERLAIVAAQILKLYRMCPGKLKYALNKRDNEYCSFSPFYYKSGYLLLKLSAPEVGTLF